MASDATISEMNVCRAKAAAFGLGGPVKGGFDKGGRLKKILKN